MSTQRVMRTKIWGKINEEKKKKERISSLISCTQLGTRNMYINKKLGDKRARPPKIASIFSWLLAKGSLAVLQEQIRDRNQEFSGTSRPTTLAPKAHHVPFLQQRKASFHCQEKLVCKWQNFGSQRFYLRMAVTETGDRLCFEPRFSGDWVTA